MWKFIQGERVTVRDENMNTTKQGYAGLYRHLIGIKCVMINIKIQLLHMVCFLLNIIIYHKPHGKFPSFYESEKTNYMFDFTNKFSL